MGTVTSLSVGREFTTTEQTFWVIAELGPEGKPYRFYLKESYSNSLTLTEDIRKATRWEKESLADAVFEQLKESMDSSKSYRPEWRTSEGLSTEPSTLSVFEVSPRFVLKSRS